jgi:hypothetical protein
MAYSKKSRIKNFEVERSFLESELRIFADNIAYFESSRAKYDVNIAAFNNHENGDVDLCGVENVRRVRDDLSERVSILYNLRIKKLDRIDVINGELKKLY